MLYIYELVGGNFKAVGLDFRLRIDFLERKSSVLVRLYRVMNTAFIYVEMDYFAFQSLMISASKLLYCREILLLYLMSGLLK